MFAQQKEEGEDGGGGGGAGGDVLRCSRNWISPKARRLHSRCLEMFEKLDITEFLNTPLDLSSDVQEIGDHRILERST